MNYKKIFNQQQGLSIIEIMVAFSILVMAFVGLAYSFPFGLSISKTAESSTVASYLAQAKIEEVISLGYDNINVGTIEAKHRLYDDTSSYLYNYQRETIVNYVDGDLNDAAEDNGIKKISCTLYFISAISNSEDSYNITTLISKR